MKDYLDGYLSILPESQRAKILDFLRTDRDLSGLSEEELEEEINNIIRRLGQGESIMSLRTQSGQTNSGYYNQTMREIYADLHTLYNECSQLDSLIENNHELNLSILKRIDKEISNMDRKIKSINLLADNNEGYVSSSQDDFIDSVLLEKFKDSSELFADRYGRKMNKSQVARVGDGYLRSAEYYSENSMQGAKIKILDQTGRGFRSDSSYNINKAIDDNQETFWSEVILSSEPIKVNTNIGLTQDVYVDEGAICKFKIEFPQPVAISEIDFLPYCELPMEILTIGYTVDETDIPYAEIKSYDSNNPVLIDDKKSFSFPSVECYGLIFVIRQSHANKVTYLVSKGKSNSVELWRQISGGPVENNMDKITGTNYQNTYTKAVSNMNANGDITEGVMSSIGAHRDKTVRQMDRYEYIYGAYNISCYNREYKQSSIYVSKPHNTSGNIQRIVLEAKEDHPKFYSRDGNLINRQADGESLPLRRTSVEYYISPKENPSSNDWIPILPLDQTNIDNELLTFMDPQMPTAKLRWQADTSSIIRVYVDEELLQRNSWSLSPNKQTLILQPDVWKPSSLYTIDYTPDVNPHIVDLSEFARPIGNTEVFHTGAGRNNTITLSYYPYVDKSKLNDTSYNPVSVALEGKLQGYDGAITERVYSTRDDEQLTDAKARLLNVTDYSRNALPALRSYDPSNYNTFEYCHYGREVYFTETFAHDGPVDNYPHSNGNASITVDYHYLVSGIRCKVVLRRTSHTDPTVSPKVLEYNLKFQTII